MDTVLKEKVCACCKKLKPTSEFSPKGKQFYSYCRECVNKKGREKSRQTAKVEGRELRVWPARPKGKKRCPRCNQWKDEAAFNKTKARYDGLSNYCKECLKIRRKAKWDLPEAKEKRRSYAIKTAYGITIEQWEQLAQIQNNKCALCLSDGNKTPRRILDTDHDHKSGRVRGLLCHRCNKFLGVLETLLDENKVDSFIQYLNQPPAFQIGV